MREALTRQTGKDRLKVTSRAVDLLRDEVRGQLGDLDEELAEIGGLGHG
jgi:hypothetical protein